MKIAVIGAGISGLGAAWLLARTNEVHLFESEPRLGGHAHTVDIGMSDPAVAVDTGFLVYNELTYPHLCGFFRALEVETAPSDMSLSIQLIHKNLEWAGNDLNSIFAQRRNLFRPSFLKMLNEILRFGREAEANVELSKSQRWSLGEMLRARRFSAEFCNDYLIPAGAAIWSTPEARMLDFPAETFLTFFINHRLLQVSGRPIWRTVRGGSRQYVEKAAKGISHVHAGVAVESVTPLSTASADGVNVRVGGADLHFDRVVMATHAPVTYRLLQRKTELEEKILSRFKTEANRAVLHTSSALMPRQRRAWASWNVQGTSGKAGTPKASLTYYINRLQPLPTTRDYFVSLNPLSPPTGVLREFSYHHPQFDRAAIDAQAEIPNIQGTGGVYFAGAWTRYGFHEDGLLSAVRVAELFGVKAPWVTP